MPKMITLKPHRFAGKARAVGDTYDAEGQAKRLSEALRWAELAPPPAPPAAPMAKTRTRAVVPESNIAASAEEAAVDLTASINAPAPDVESDENAAAKKIKTARATYRRCDLTAEE